LPIAFLFCFSNQVQAQAGTIVTISGSCSPLVDTDYTYNGIINGKRSYLASTASGDFLISWNSTLMRWQHTNSSGAVGMVNTANTSNPPPGVWTAIGCNPSGTFSGTGTISSALPVELINFKADHVNKKINLKWQTASETDNEGFYIQYSRNGIEWEEIDFVNGAGNTLEQQDYEYMVHQPKSGANYFRLRQVDFDGVFELSPVVVVDLSAQNGELNIHPNPTSDRINLTLPTGFGEEDNASYKIIASSGKIMMNGKISNQAAEALDVSSLIPGIYSIQVFNARSHKDSKFIKLK